MNAPEPHGSQPPFLAGPAPEEAAAALVLVHGRGGSAEDIVGLAEALDRAELTVIAPRAAGNTWYPQSFLAPVAANEPGRSSGLAVLESIVADLGRRGLASQKVILAGFSQGACLTLEFIARHPRRYGAVAGLTGGLIGPPGNLGGYGGSLDSTPVFLGSGDPDPHVPWARVEETAAILQGMGAQVQLQSYPGRPHVVSQAELERLQSLVDDVLADH